MKIQWVLAAVREIHFLVLHFHVLIKQDILPTQAIIKPISALVDRQTLGKLTVGGKCFLCQVKTDRWIYWSGSKLHITVGSHIYNGAELGYYRMAFRRQRPGKQIGFNDGQYTNPVWGAYHNTITSIDDRTVSKRQRLLTSSVTVVRVDYNAGINSYALFRDQIIDKSSYGKYGDNALGNTYRSC